MVAIIYDEDGNILETVPNVRRSHKLTDTYHEFKGDESKIWLSELPPTKVGGFLLQ